MTRTRQLCTFTVDGLYCGLEVQFIEEIVGHRSIAAVPLAPPTVYGLVNLRGQIVTALDLRRCLSLPDRAATDDLVNIVVQTDEGPMSLVVDAFGDVVDVDDADLEPAPPHLPEDLRALVLGTYRLPDQLLIVLNIHRILMPDADQEESDLDALPSEPSAEDEQWEHD